jgi:hypothetical protein
MSSITPTHGGQITPNPRNLSSKTTIEGISSQTSCFHSNRKLKGCCFVVAFALGMLGFDLKNCLAGGIRFGQPNANGELTLMVRGMPIRIQGITAAMTPGEKRDHIFLVGGLAQLLVQKDGTNGIVANFGLGIKPHSDTTGEETELFAPNPLTGLMAFDADLGSFAGVDSGGQESRFEGGFSFDGSMVGFDIAFSELESNSPNAILDLAFNQMLSQLPSPIRGSLSLDLPAKCIHFVFPEETLFGEVHVGSTDVRSKTGADLRAVPEPSVWGLAMVGLFVGAGFVMRRRKLTPGEEWSRSKLS